MDQDEQQPPSRAKAQRQGKGACSGHIRHACSQVGLLGLLSSTLLSLSGRGLLPSTVGLGVARAAAAGRGPQPLTSHTVASLQDRGLPGGAGISLRLPTFQPSDELGSQPSVLKFNGVLLAAGAVASSAL